MYTMKTSPSVNASTLVVAVEGLLLASMIAVADAFVITSPSSQIRKVACSDNSVLYAAQVGIFYGTSTGSTQECADMIQAELGDDVADGPFDIESIDASELQSTLESYNSLIVGSPTWNTAADSHRVRTFICMYVERGVCVCACVLRLQYHRFRRLTFAYYYFIIPFTCWFCPCCRLFIKSGTGWDELYYKKLPEFNLAGKKVAVFGLGDQVSYAENYADAAGELFDVFEGLGCTMFGFTSQDGYEHEDSKTIRGEKFCGLLLDMVNQEELSEERIQSWVAQLRGEGFLVDGAATAGPTTPVVTETKAEEFFQTIDEHSSILDETIESFGSGGFSPYYNPKTKSTMWVSADGRSCYYTEEVQAAGTAPWLR